MTSASNKVAVVTGAGSGIGRSVALGLANAGWSTIFCGRRLPVLEAALAETDRSRTNSIAVQCDVSDAAQVEHLFQHIERSYGRLDLLFNNAGTGLPPKLADEVSVAEWDTVVRTNLTGAFLCARSAFGLMRRQRPMGGRIINNGSISSHSPRPGSIAYTATKHAITGLTKSLALDGRAFGIACGQIDIGNASTELAASIGSGTLQANGNMAAEPMMDVGNVTRSVLTMAALPLDANILSLTVMATTMPFVGRG